MSDRVRQSQGAQREDNYSYDGETNTDRSRARTSTDRTQTGRSGGGCCCGDGGCCCRARDEAYRDRGGEDPVRARRHAEARARMESEFSPDGCYGGDSSQYRRRASRDDRTVDPDYALRRSIERQQGPAYLEAQTRDAARRVTQNGYYESGQYRYEHPHHNQRNHGGVDVGFGDGRFRVQIGIGNNTHYGRTNGGDYYDRDYGHQRRNGGDYYDSDYGRQRRNGQVVYGRRDPWDENGGRYEYPYTVNNGRNSGYDQYGRPIGGYDQYGRPIGGDQYGRNRDYDYNRNRDYDYNRNRDYDYNRNRDYDYNRNRRNPVDEMMRGNPLGAILGEVLGANRRYPMDERYPGDYRSNYPYDNGRQRYPYDYNNGSVYPYENGRQRDGVYIGIGPHGRINGGIQTDGVGINIGNGGNHHRGNYDYYRGDNTRYRQDDYGRYEDPYGRGVYQRQQPYYSNNYPYDQSYPRYDSRYGHRHGQNGVDIGAGVNIPIGNGGSINIGGILGRVIR
jgi:hypothetical protein